MIKKIMVILAVLMIVIVSFVLTVYADEAHTLTKEDVTYEKLEDNTIRIIDYNYDKDSNPYNNIIIPETIDGYTVTEIGESYEKESKPSPSAYNKPFIEKGLTSVVIPDTVTCIGFYAFAQNEITSVAFSKNLQEIGVCAFFMNKLQNITIPDTVTKIMNAAFNKNELEAIELGNSIETILDDAFANNKIEHIQIPNSTKTIGDYAFYDNRMKTLVLGNQVEKIGTQAFGNHDGVGNNSLKSVVIPDSVTSIGDKAFQRLGLEEVTLGSSIQHIGEGAFRMNAINNLIIKNGVTKIDGSNVFEMNQLESVTFPNSLTEIGEFAFSQNKLKHITIPSNVSKIGMAAFFLNNLSEITIANATTVVAGYSFNGQRVNGVSIKYWFKNREYTETPVQKIENDIRTGPITYYAYYEVDVIFDEKGGSNTTDVSNQKAYTLLTKPADPTKENYTFGGWFLDDDTFTEPWDFTKDTLTQNITLYAKWIGEPRTITLDEKGGVDIADFMTAYGNIINKEDILEPTREGFSFAGWYNDEDLASPVAFPYTIYNDTVWYAKWEEPRTITLDENGGSDVDDIVANWNSIINEEGVPQPTREGYRFEFWWRGEVCIPSYIISFPYTVTRDITWHAKWEEMQDCTVIFETNGGSHVSSITDVTYNTTIAAPITPAKSGCNFLDWYKESECINAWDFDNDRVTEDITLYAKWGELSKHTVTFEENGGNLVNDLIDIDHNRTIAAITTTKSGYNFLGWYKESEFINLWDFENDTVTEDITLYAKWNKKHSSGSKKTKTDNKVKGDTAQGSFDVGEKKTTTKNGKKQTIIKVDSKAIEKQMEKIKKKDRVTVPVTGKNDISQVQFNVQDVKNMQEKKLVLEVKTDNATYELPTTQVDVNAISEEIGEEVKLSDIPFTISISKTGEEMVKVVKTSTGDNGLAVMVPSIDFEIEATYKNKTYKVSKFNNFVTRMIEIPAGTDMSKITTAIVTEKDGRSRHIPTYVTVVDGKYYAVINALTNSTYTLIYNEATFSDVKDNHWGKQDIEKMAARLIVEGEGNGIFNPSEAITRAEMAQILVKALGLKPEAVNQFIDVEKGTKIAEYIGTAYSYGIIKGTSATTFNPNDFVTRQDAMTMIYRAGEIADFKDKGNNMDMNSYVDYKDVSDYAKKSAIWNVNNGIIYGKSETTLVPFDNITRAEISAVVNRFLTNAGLIEDKK